MVDLNEKYKNEGRDGTFLGELVFRLAEEATSAIGEVYSRNDERLYMLQMVVINLTTKLALGLINSKRAEDDVKITLEQVGNDVFSAFVHILEKYKK